MWQPIETAPKDGTHILAFPVLLNVACVVSWSGTGYWRLPMTDKATPYTPTKWMPVPAPEPEPEPSRDIMDGRGRRDIMKNPRSK